MYVLKATVWICSKHLCSVCILNYSPSSFVASSIFQVRCKMFPFTKKLVPGGIKHCMCIYIYTHTNEYFYMYVVIKWVILAVKMLKNCLGLLFKKIMFFVMILGHY